MVKNRIEVLVRAGIGWDQLGEIRWLELGQVVRGYQGLVRVGDRGQLPLERMPDKHKPKIRVPRPERSTGTVVHADSRTQRERARGDVERAALQDAIRESGLRGDYSE
jgi:hypothetical protein